MQARTNGNLRVSDKVLIHDGNNEISREKYTFLSNFLSGCQNRCAIIPTSETTSRNCELIKYDYLRSSLRNFVLGLRRFSNNYRQYVCKR